MNKCILLVFAILGVDICWGQWQNFKKWTPPTPPKPEKNLFYDEENNWNPNEESSIFWPSESPDNSLSASSSTTPPPSLWEQEQGGFTTERFESTTTARFTAIHTLPQGCNCIYTTEFNPVCGTDGNTYRSANLLKCHTRCGTRVTLRRRGPCN